MLTVSVAPRLIPYRRRFRMMPKLIWPLAGAWLSLLSFHVPLRAQPGPAAFEIASVKPSPPGPNGVHGGCHGVDSVYTPGQAAAAPPLGRCVIGDARLSHL